MEKYDVAVIGGGPGGYVAAIRSAEHGRSVVLFENHELGGTCLNRGCIPTKVLLQSAELYSRLKKAADFGVHADGVSFDYGEMVHRKCKISAKLSGGVAMLLKKHKVTVINAEARLASAHRIVAEGIEYAADSVILAAGSRPVKLPIPGADLDGVCDSTELLSMSRLPESIVIVGGGVIGIEFATLFNLLGKKVTIIELLPQIMGANMDKELCAVMSDLLQSKGVEIRTSATVREIQPGLRVIYEQNGEERFAQGECVLVAAGRKPMLQELGVEEVGIEASDGFIDVDCHMRTNIPGVYAIGDLTGKAQLASAASAQGKVAADDIAGIPNRIRYELIPYCIFSEPEVAWVGLSREQAEERGYNVKTGSFHTAGNGKCMVVGDSVGFSKIVTDTQTGEILGAQIMAPNATEIISSVIAAMSAESTVEELATSVFAHPTISEIVMESAQDCMGLCCNK